MVKSPPVKWFLIIFVLWAVFFILLQILFQPSHDRDWELGHEFLPQFIFFPDSSLVTINNYRDFAWTNSFEATPNYIARTFDMTAVTGVDVLISHFDDFEGLAHIFLSFPIDGDDPVVISLETRRETHEKFSPLLGILRQFEIIYVVGSERDVIGVRTGHRNERVHLYPTKATPEQGQALLRELIHDINDVYSTPRMYNTITRNCTNEITRKMGIISPVRFPLTWKTILPGYFDEVLYDLNIIDTTLPFAEIKAKHLIDNTEVSSQSATYSEDIRTEINIR